MHLEIMHARRQTNNITYSLEFRVHATTKMDYNSCMYADKGYIACNNNNMRNPSLHFISWGYACCYKLSVCTGGLNLGQLYNRRIHGVP